jgi:hypothetical protein
VRLYFIVQVEVVEIQIWFEFKLICNLQNRFEKEKKKNFLIGNRLQAEFGAAQSATARAAYALSRSFEPAFIPFPISSESSRDRV